MPQKKYYKTRKPKESKTAPAEPSPHFRLSKKAGIPGVEAIRPLAQEDKRIRREARKGEEGAEAHASTKPHEVGKMTILPIRTTYTPGFDAVDYCIKEPVMSEAVNWPENEEIKNEAPKKANYPGHDRSGGISLDLMHRKEDWIQAAKTGFITCQGHLEEFSRERTGVSFAPSYQELSQIATNELWLEQRMEYMQAGKKGSELDKAEVLSRQLRIAKKAQDLAESALDMLKPEDLHPREVIAMAKWGAMAEQMLMGINHNPMVQFRVDFGTLSDSDLDLIIASNNRAVTPHPEDIARKAVDNVVNKATRYNTVDVESTPTKSANPYGSYDIKGEDSPDSDRIKKDEN